MSTSCQFNDSQTSIVSEFYDRFPYPDNQFQNGPPKDLNWLYSWQDVCSFCIGAIRKSENFSTTIRILDAGCGTGLSTDYLAHLNPRSDIFAVDISGRSLQLAQERLEHSGGHNMAHVRFKNLSLFALNLEEVGRFDYINSIGVLHHLQDPLSGLIKLKSLLKTDGLIHLFLYADGGRSEVKRINMALKSMKISSSKEGIRLARKMLSELPKNNLIRENFEKQWAPFCGSDSVFADTYFHPFEINFNLEKLLKLINQSGLNFVGFSNRKTWDIKRVLSGELLKTASDMEESEKWKLIELLDPQISYFDFFLSKGKPEKFDWCHDKYLLESRAKISKCISGWPDKKLIDFDMNLIEISDSSFQLLEAIEENPGTPLGMLGLNLEKSKIASIARDLQQKQVLLLIPL